MCSVTEVQQIVANSNKQMKVHLDYIRKSLDENKEQFENNRKEHVEILDKFESYIEAVKKSHATNEKVDMLEEKLDKLSSIVSKVLGIAVTSIIGNLIAIVWFLINNFVIK